MLPSHPELNATVQDDVISRWSSVNFGMAVALDEGLLVPVIRDADRLSLAELAEERARLVQLAQSGRLRSRDLLGATFTVTNLGYFGIDAFTPIINPPEGRDPGSWAAEARCVDDPFPHRGSPGCGRCSGGALPGGYGTGS